MLRRQESVPVRTGRIVGVGVPVAVGPRASSRAQGERVICLLSLSVSFSVSAGLCLSLEPAGNLVYTDNSATSSGVVKYHANRVIPVSLFVLCNNS